MAQTTAGATTQYPRTPVSPERAPWNGGRRPVSRGSLQRSPQRKAPMLDQPEVRLQETPASPVSISPPRAGLREAEAGSIRGIARDDESIRSSRNLYTPDSGRMSDSATSLPLRERPPSGGVRLVGDGGEPHSRASSSSGPPPRIEEFGPDLSPPEQEESALHYHGFDDAPKKRTQNRASQMTLQSQGSSSSGENSRQSQLLAPRPVGLQRPASSYTLGSELRGRTLSPLSANGSDQGSPQLYARDLSGSRRSPSSRPVSYIDLLNNVPYAQQVAPGAHLDNTSLQSVVGNAASLLDTKKTLEMYRANVKKTTDNAVQYEFAIFMINAARSSDPSSSDLDPDQLITEAKHILQRLSDRAYPFAQYYLGDGYSSGLFSKKPDYDRAFANFLAASKHGHAESSYRAALAYEFGWGTAKSYPKAVQFYRTAASKNHPGAATRLALACLRGDMGLSSKTHYREGVKWLKRAQESADAQYNSAPYELALLHLSGYGEDIFKDEAYAAQLLTQAAELGHAQANFMLGQAYENGWMGCPRDAGLSVHFYTGAAGQGHAEGMMALCAWYMVGAEPVLEKDEGEAFAWARQAAETGFPKAEYAVGYFTEMGIGCRRDPLEANVWYVHAAEKGNETAKQRLEIIRQAAAGGAVGDEKGAGAGTRNGATIGGANGPIGGGQAMTKAEPKSKDLNGNSDSDGAGKKRFMGIF